MIQWRLPLFILFGTTLFSLALIKAATAAITWDEAFTYFEFIKTVKLYPGAGGGMAANNHLLNTWISFLFTNTLGTDELMLRAGNLLFFTGYLSSSIWLALRAKSFVVSSAVFSLLCLNPYIFDFFCLSRGYGMAHACLLLNIVFIYSYFQTGKNSRLKWMILSSLAGILAGSMLLPAFGLFYAVLFFILPVVIAQDTGIIEPKIALSDSLQRIPFLFHLMFAVAIISGAAYLILLQKFDAFLFGGDSGIITDLFISVLQNSIYHSEHPVVYYATLLAVLMLLLFLLKEVIKNRVFLFVTAEGKAAMVILLTAFGIGLLHGVLYLLFSTPLPTERTALYLYILTGSVISLTLLAVERNSYLLNFFCAITTLLMMAHFISTFNLQTFNDWQADADAPLMIRDISKIKLSETKKPFRTFSSLELEMPLKFYLEKNQEVKNKISIERISKPVKTAEIYFLEKNDSEISDSLEREKSWFKIRYPQGGTLIYSPLIGK